jgi:ERCC4-related helicase
LLIFDECHHSKGENCYAALMKRHYEDCRDPPRILGLTASISAQKIKPDQLSPEAQKIEETYK